MKKINKKIALISFSSYNDFGVQRFKKEAEDLGYQTEIFLSRLFFVSFDNKKINVYHDEKLINPEKYLVFIPLVSTQEDLPENTFFLDALAKLNTNIANQPEAIRLAKNKTASLFKLANDNVPIIPSAVNFSNAKLGPLFKSIKNEDFICKSNKGSSGRGVAIIKSKISLISIFELMMARKINPATLLFQKFIRGAKGKDIRVIVSDNKIVAAMERCAVGIDFRSNLSGSGEGKKINNLPTEIKKIAIKAINSIGLDYGGVDVIVSRKKIMILEVNANPGLRIEEITGTNVARKILQHIVKKYEK